MQKKLSDQLEDHTFANKNASLCQQFKNIAAMVQNQLNMIVDQRAQNADDEDSEESLNVKELCNDFATEEFA